MPGPANSRGKKTSRRKADGRRAAVADPRPTPPPAALCDFSTRLLDALPTHLAVLDRHGKVVAVNRECARVGCPQRCQLSLAVGADYLAFCDAQANEDQDAADSGRAIRAVVEGARELVETDRRCHAPGPARWVRMTVTPLAVPEGGAVVMHHDITHLKHVESELVESERRFEKIANELPVILWMQEADTDALYVNQAGYEITGWRPGDFSLQAWLEAMHPDDLHQHWSYFTEAMAKRQRFLMEYRYRHASGDYRWLLDCGVPRYRADGSFAGYMGVGIDIHNAKEAERERAELAAQLLRAQEEERRNIARELHDDIAQRLAVLSIRLQQLEQGEHGRASALSVAELREQAKQLSRDVGHMSHLLHSAYLEHLGLGAAVSSQCKEVATVHRLEVDCRVGELPAAPGHEVELSVFRVVQEALRNVVQHSRASKVRAELAADGNQLVLRVVDNGVGFDPKAAGNGEGLGLVSMRERLRLLGGSLSISSGPTAGTIVEARVPLAREPGREEQRVH